MNMHTSKLFLFAIFIIVIVYIYTCESYEHMYVPPNMVGSGDFHIEQPGAIADQGSFTNDMNSYINGHGQI